MKTSQSLQLLDTNDVNISPIIGVESLFYEKDDGTNIVKRKTLHDKMLFSEKDGSLSISEMSYDDASNLSIIVDLSTYVNEGDNPSLHRLGVSVVSMQDFMGVIDEKIEQGGGGGGFDPTNINASIRDISARLANANTSISDLNDIVDSINTQIEGLDDIYVTNDKFDESIGAINASLNKFDPSIKWLDSSVKKLWDSSNSGGGTIEGVRDVRVNNHSVVEGNVAYLPKIPAQLSDLIDDATHRVVTDASINAWNNGGLTSGHSILGSINGNDFIYGTNITISGSDDVRDIKYGSNLPCGFSSSQQQSTIVETLDISAGTILGFDAAYYNCYMPINASAYFVEDGLSFVLNIDYPIFICAETTQLNSQNPNFNDAYIYKTNVDLSDVYKLKQSGHTGSNDYALFPQMRDVYLKGEIYQDTTNLIKLDSSILIVDNTSYLHKNIIDKNDSEKRFKYIHIGYTYTENFKYDGQLAPESTSKIHFYGGIPRVYYYDITTQKLEPYIYAIDLLEDSLETLQSDIATNVSPAIISLDNSVNIIEKSIYNVNEHYALDDQSSEWSLMRWLVKPNDTYIGGYFKGKNVIDIDLKNFWDEAGLDHSKYDIQNTSIYISDKLFGSTENEIKETFGKHDEKSVEIRFIKDTTSDYITEVSGIQYYHFVPYPNNTNIIFQTPLYNLSNNSIIKSKDYIAFTNDDTDEFDYVIIRRIHGIYYISFGSRS